MKNHVPLEMHHLIGYVETCRTENTSGWMEGLCHVLNKALESVGSDERVATHGEGLQIITPEDVADTMLGPL